MARQLRIQYPSAIYHIMARGDGGQNIFNNPGDYKMFLKTYQKVLEDYNWISYAYCLMPNHYHLFIKIMDPNLSLGMKQLNGVYTKQYNIKRGRLGHVFQGRFKSILVEDLGYQGKLIRYIVMNPIRAGLVKNVGDWRWSSHKEMIDEKIESRCLHRKEALRFFEEDIYKARKRYIEYLCEELYNDNVWEDLNNGFILGSIEFVTKIMTKYGKKSDSADIPKRERFAGRPEIDILFKGIKNKKERNKKILESFYDFGYTQAEIANYFGFHHSTISRIIKRSKFTA